jgi:hypothetical protein
MTIASAGNAASSGPTGGRKNDPPTADAMPPTIAAGAVTRAAIAMPNATGRSYGRSSQRSTITLAAKAAAVIRTTAVAASTTSYPTTWGAQR